MENLSLQTNSNEHTQIGIKVDRLDGGKTTRGRLPFSLSSCSLTLRYSSSQQPSHSSVVRVSTTPNRSSTAGLMITLESRTATSVPIGRNVRTCTLLLIFCEYR